MSDNNTNAANEYSTPPAPNNADATPPRLPYAMPPRPGASSQTGTASPYNTPTSPDVAPPPVEYAYRSPVSGLVQAATASDNPHPARLLAGAVLGCVAGFIGAWLYSKFVYYLHFEFALLTSAIGYLVGIAVVIGSGRGGLVPAIMGAVISLVSILGSSVMVENAQESAAAGEAVYIALSARNISILLADTNPLSWLIIAFGVYGGFMTPWRAGLKQQGAPPPAGPQR